jgi:phosphatidylserine decarboxylase
MIKFGSQVDVVIPDLNNLRITVEPDMEVRAGESVIAEFG